MKYYKLSIRLMTFNHVNYIEEALKGIDIQKTDFNFEVVVGDDFSTDDTLTKIRNYNFSNPNLHLRVLEREVGDSYYKERKKNGRLYNFVNILNNCTGDYIALLDGDDYWTDPLKLQKQVDFLEGHPEYVITYHNAKAIDEIGKLISNSELSDNLKQDFSQWELITKPYLLSITMCFKNIIKNYPKEFFNVLNGDTFLISLLGNYGEGKYMADVNDARYRKHSLGVWSLKNPFYQNLSQLQTYLKIETYYKILGKREVANYFANRNTQQLLGLIKDVSSYKEILMVVQMFFMERKFRSLYLLLLYFFSYKITGRGYFFKKRLYDKIRSGENLVQ